MGAVVTMRPDQTARRAVRSVVRCAGGGVVVEVGSYRGESARQMLDTGLVKRLYCVDPWACGYDSSDVASSSDMAEAERSFDSMVGCDPRVVKLKGRLSDFREKLEGLEPDLVYIDACHQYEPCRADILFARDVMRARAVGGHDYDDRWWPGVRRAVQEAFGQPDARFPDSSWLVFTRS